MHFFVGGNIISDIYLKHSFYMLQSNRITCNEWAPFQLANNYPSKSLPSYNSTASPTITLLLVCYNWTKMIRKLSSDLLLILWADHWKQKAHINLKGNLFPHHLISSSALYPETIKSFLFLSFAFEWSYVLSFSVTALCLYIRHLVSVAVCPSVVLD